MSAGHQVLRVEVARIARLMLASGLGPRASGLVIGTSGNVSARTDDGDVLISPSGLDYALLGPEDVVLMDARGRMVEGRLETSSEWPMHTGMYRSEPGVSSIYLENARFREAHS